ncbi:MAG: YndJ family transporter [Myxococcota bacterium]
MLGLLLWLVAPFLPAEHRPSFGSLEHGFLFMPLVLAPPLVQLADTLLGGRCERFSALARRALAGAGALVVVSFLVPRGMGAAVFAMPWLILAVALAGRGVRRTLAHRDRGTATVIAGHVFLVIGAVWLLLSRLGAAPRHLSETTVLLAALHFHFSGFALQILVAGVGRKLSATSRALRLVVACVSPSAAVAIALIAAGNLLALPLLKFCGVIAMVLCVVALAGLCVVAARASAERAARWLFASSATVLASGMLLAAAYGLAELTVPTPMSLALMTTTHGLANQLGVALCVLALTIRPEGCHSGTP